MAEGPGKFTTYAGNSAPDAALTLIAGFSLVAAALVLTFTGRSARIADLAILAALAWFTSVFIGWEEGPALVRSLGTVVAGLWFPVLTNVALAYPRGRVSSRPARVLVTALYIAWFVAAAVLALVRDPYADASCWSDCYAVNSFLVHSVPSLAHAVETVYQWFVFGAAAALIGTLIGRFVRGSGPSRSALAPIAAPAILLGAAVAAHSIALSRVTAEDPTQPPFAVIFIVTSSSVTLIGAGLVFAALRTRSQRLAIARMVGSLGEAPEPGTLASALAGALRDPALQIAYWLPSSQRYVDALGRGIDAPRPGPGRVVTTLASGDRTIAVVSHAGTHPDLERELGPALRLGLENERLQAEVLAQLEEIRASRERIVETGDAERRRLERDLHDGAQQRILALSYDIKLAGVAADTEGEREAEALLADAAGEARTALYELRELAHGIFPAILAEAGLGPALETLSDLAPIPLELQGLTEVRMPPAVEMAAYVVVREALDDASERGATNVTAHTEYTESRFVLTVEDDGSERTSSMIVAADRVAALGGTLQVESRTLRADLPYA